MNHKRKKKKKRKDSAELLGAAHEDREIELLQDGWSCPRTQYPMARAIFFTTLDNVAWGL
jgi:hypothetical protein